jgi:tRNA A-37 threonylcarbamoyl transferase component Bud32
MEELTWGMWLIGLVCLASFSLLVVFVFVGVLVRASQRSDGALTSPRQCPSCGAELPGDAPEGLCPRCLLKEAIQSPVSPAPRPIGEGTAPHQGSFSAPPLADLAGRFPQLEIIDILGQGGMGAVYKARQTKLDRPVALKILPPEAGTDSAFADRFTREARALAKLSHPNIVAVHDFGDAGGLFYLLMEYVDGVNLRQLMQAGRIEPGQALSIVGQICDALQFAHDEGIVHRDIKPENVLIDQKGRVKIADFGLAKLLHPTPVDFSLTGTRQIMGTPHYMAPEQMEKPQTVDHRADIYSLGVLFYEMLTGELPLGRFALPSQKATVDPRLDEIVLRALEKEPERRYQRVSELKQSVDSVLGGASFPSPLMNFLGDKQLAAALGGAFSPSPRTEAMPTYQEELAEENLRMQVRGPAAGLMVTAGIAFVQWAAVGFSYSLEIWSQPGWNIRQSWLVDIVLGPVLCGLALVLAVSVFVVGARKLRRFHSYEFVLIACVFAILPWSLGALVGIPIGIWGLVVLQRPEVKAAFVRNALAKRRKTAAIARAEEEIDREVAMQLAGPAAGLIITAVLALVFWGVLAVTFVEEERHWWADDYRGYHRVDLWPDLGNGALVAILMWAFAGAIFYGARKMLRLESPLRVNIAVILAMAPWSLAAVVGIPVGIWTMMVLRRPRVRSAFAQKAALLGQEAARDPSALPQPGASPGKPLVIAIKANAKGLYEVPAPEPLRTTPLPASAELVELELLRLRVKGPAVALVVTGVVALAQWAALGLYGFFTIPLPPEDWGHTSGFWIGALFLTPLILATATLLFVAARWLKRFERYEFVVLAAIIAMLPWSAAWIIGIIVGAWTSLVLRRRDVQLAFTQNALRAQTGYAYGPAAPGGGWPMIRSMMMGIKSLFLSSRLRSSRSQEPGDFPVAPQSSAPGDAATADWQADSERPAQ